MSKIHKVIKVIFLQFLKQSKFLWFLKKTMIRIFFANKRNLSARKPYLSMKASKYNLNKHKKNLISKKIRNISLETETKILFPKINKLKQSIKYMYSEVKIV